MNQLTGNTLHKTGMNYLSLM